MLRHSWQRVATLMRAILTENNAKMIRVRIIFSAASAGTGAIRERFIASEAPVAYRMSAYQLDNGTERRG